MCPPITGRRGRSLASTGAGFVAIAFTASLALPAHAQAPSTSSVTPPTVVQHVDAVYPPTALAWRRHADVVLVVTVDADGHVSTVEVAQSGGPDLDEAAVVAARQWTFVPASRDGKAVASRIKMPFHFAPPAPPPEVVETAKPDELPVSPATATSSSPAPVPPAAAAAEQVEVLGRIEPRFHGISDTVFTMGALAAVPHRNAEELLKLAAPGILLTNEGGEGHAEQVFLRGFDAREGQDLEFSVDGVPINDAGNLHGNGYADTHFIIPELVRALHVVEGPFAPQQGNFAVAGSADYELGLENRGLTAKYTTGSYGTQRLLLTWGPNDQEKGTFAGAEYSTTDGFGQNRQAKRGSAIGQYETALGGGAFRVTAQAYDTEFNTAGVVREDNYARGRKGFFDAEDLNLTGNTASRYSIALAYQRRNADFDFSQQLFLLQREMRLREDFTGFVEDVQEASQQLHGQRGDLLDLQYQGTTLGARGSARWHGAALGQKQELELGYFARSDWTASTQDRIDNATGAPYKRDVDLNGILGDVGVYVDANVRLLRWLGLRGGVRADMFLFNVLNNCAVQTAPDFPKKQDPQIDVSCFSQGEHGVYREPIQRSASGDGAILPKATVLVGPFEHFQFAGSYGEGVRSIDPIYVSQGFATPFVRVQAFEGGASYARSFGGAMGEGSASRQSVTVSARSVFFQTHVDRDLVFNQTVGRNTLSNGSTRTGWVGAARVSGSFFDESANLTLVKATFDDTRLLVPYVPDLVLRSDTVIFHDLPWKLARSPVTATLGYGVTYVGERPLPYGQLSDVLLVSDASLTVRWRSWELALVGTNAFDARYRLGEYNYVSDFHSQPEPTLTPARAFTAGAPRMLFLSISATLGGA
ncbi:MAG: TonB family protein [Myxococcota bacterium]|nr:TonB family protein [Myxococcota bacterium]